MAVHSVQRFTAKLPVRAEPESPVQTVEECGRRREPVEGWDGAEATAAV
jgi:hypothetical protein